MTRSTAEESVKIQRTRVLSWKHRIAPFLTPWLIMIGVFIASVITHAFMRGPVALVFLTLMAPGLGMVTWATWDRRHQHARNAATAFTVGMGLWLALATAVGPFQRNMIYTGLLGGAFLCLTWNIRYAGITPTNKHDALSGQHVDPLSVIKGLKGVVTKKAKLVQGKDGAPPVAEIILQHPGGKSTTADVLRRKDNVAGAYSMDSGSIHVSKVPGRGDQTKITGRVLDPTANVVTWPGVSMPGRSINDGPLRTGIYEDGQAFGHWITGDEDESRVASATMYSGMTGAGKTRAYMLSMLEMISRVDCAIPAVADPEKFLLSFGMIMDYIPIAVDGPAQTDQFVRNIIEAMRYRGRLLGSLGFEQWTPECASRYGIPCQPLHVEEAGGYLANFPEFTKALMIARSMGLPISISLQVAVFRQLQREARSQFGNSLAFGVRELRDATFALTDATLSSGAGAQLTTWQNNEPGRFYGEITGVPANRWAMKVRAFKASRNEIVASFEASMGAGIMPCDPGTFELLSQGIERPKRMSLLDLPKASAEGSRDGQTIILPRPVETAPVEDRKPGPDQAHDLIKGRVRELLASGVTECTAADFEDLVQALGRDRTWIYPELARCVSEDLLVRQPGKGARYTINGDHRKEL
jgi:hypothetical protein